MKENALNAKKALDRYNEIVNSGDTKTAICDLIADLRHLCDAKEIDWDSVLYTAIEVYYKPEAEGVQG